MPPLIAFDFDGTLADTGRDLATALNKTLAQNNLPAASDADVLQWVGYGVLRLLERALAHCGRDISMAAQLYNAFLQNYRDCFLDTTALYPGVLDCLRQLASGHSMVIISNKPEKLLRPLVSGLGLDIFFKYVVGGDTAGVKKPDLRVWLHVCGRLNHKGPGAIVGDTPIDMEFGRQAKLKTVACTWGFRALPALKEARPDHLVSHPSQIPAIFQEP